MTDVVPCRPTVARSSFALFVFPFVVEDRLLAQFSTWRSTFDAWQQRIAAVRFDNLPVWTASSFNPAGLLPHVRDYLNAPSDSHATATLWTLNGNFLQSPNGLGGGNNRDIKWYLRTKAKSSDGPNEKLLPFRIDSARLSLFESGVGFLTVEARPESTQVEDWHDFVHFFRFAGGRRDTSIHGRSDTPVFGKVAKQNLEPEPYFPACAGGLEQFPNGQGTFGDIVQSLLNLSGPIDGIQNWWRDLHVPGQLIPYVAMFVNQAPESEQPAILFRSRRFFHHAQQLVVEPATLAAASNARTWQYVDRHFFNFSLDGTSFVGFDSPQTPFFEQTLPDHLQAQYFLLMQLAWQQRGALLTLSHLLAETWHSGPVSQEQEPHHSLQRMHALEQLHDLLLSFMARGHFTQVTPEENHHTAYTRWCDVLEVDQLFREVRDQVSHLHGYLNRRKTDALTERVADNVTEVAHVQRAIHLLELVIFPIYIVELWAHLRHGGAAESHGHEATGWWAKLGQAVHLELVVVFAVAFFVTFLVVERDWIKKKLGGPTEPDNEPH